MNFAIHALEPSRLDDFLDFFDNRAFSDNPDWAGCYCVSNHLDISDEDWFARSGGENRAEAVRMIQSGVLKGYLAYDGGVCVGWCNVNDKAAVVRFAALGTPSVPSRRVAAVTCFATDPRYRRRGIARVLLDRACRDYTASGYAVMEAHPQTADESCAAHYHGHPDMLAAAGFVQSADGADCMQKRLEAPADED